MKGAVDPGYQCWSGEAPLQAKRSDGEAFSQSLKLTTEQNIHTQNVHICDQYGAVFQSPSDLAPHLQSREKTAGQEESQTVSCSRSTLAPISLPVQTENMFADSSKTINLKQMQSEQSTPTQNLHICNQCGKGFLCLSELVLHQCAHIKGKTAKQSPCQSRIPSHDPMAPVLLQDKENLLANSSQETFCQKSTLGMDQGIHTPYLYICEHCGKCYRWRSDLTRHQRVHHDRKATKQRVHPSEANPLVSVTLPLQEENVFVSPGSAFRPKSKLRTDQNSRTKKQNICDQCGKRCRKAYDLALHYQCEHPSRGVGKTDQNILTEDLHICDQCGKGYLWRSDLYRHHRINHGRKVGEQRKHQSEAGPIVPSPSPLQGENMIGSPEPTFQTELKLTNDQNTRTKKQHICDQCGKWFRKPYDLAIHYRRQHPDIAMPREHQSEAGPLVSARLPVLPASTLRSKSGLKTARTTRINNLHICDQCGMGYQWLCHLARHRSVDHGIKAGTRREHRSKAFGLYTFARREDQQKLVSIPLQEEKTFVSPARPRSKPGTDLSAHTRKKLICRLCGKGFRYPSDLARHRLSCLRKSTRQKKRQSEASPPVSVTLPLQSETTFTAPESMFIPKTKLTADQRIRTKNQVKNIGYYCGKSYWWPSDLARHERANHGRTAKQRACQSEADPLVPVPLPLQEEDAVDSPEAHSPSPLALIPLQTKNVFANSPAMFNPEPGLLAGRSIHATDPHIRGQNQNGFWWPSGPVQHPYVHCEGKTAGWAPFSSKGCRSSHLVPHPLQVENIVANSYKTFFQNSRLVTEQSTYLHTCSHCGNVCQWTPPLDQHQHQHSEAKLARQGYCQPAACSPSPGMSIPLPLQEANPEQMRDWSIKTQDLQIGNHSGNCFQWPPGLTQHPCVHSWGGVARGGRCQSKVEDTSPSTSVNMLVQVVSQFANVQKAISPRPKPMTGPFANSKGPSLCDLYGEGFRWLSDLTHSRERPHSCTVCGSQFTRRVQLVKHQKLHKEPLDSEEEEEDGEQPQSGCEEEDIPTEQEQWLPPQGTEELCEPFASSIAYDRHESPTGGSSSPEPPPPNSIWEIGVSGQPYVISLERPYECGNCGSCDHSTIDIQSTELASFGVDDTASSDWTSPVGFQDASVPVPPTAAWGANDDVEEVLRKEGSPASPTTVGRVRQPSDVASENFTEYSAESSFLSSVEDSALEEDDKPYACPKCPKQFKVMYSLKRHLAIHQKMKPHRCKKCGMSFVHSSYLAKHMRRHTR